MYIAHYCTNGGDHSLGESCGGNLINDAYNEYTSISEICTSSGYDNSAPVPNELMNLSNGIGGGGANTDIEIIAFEHLFLDDNQKNWWNDPSNVEYKIKFIDFLNLNPTDEAKAFTSIAINTLISGVQVDSGFSYFVDEQPVKTYLGTVSDLKNLLDFSPREVGKFKGREAITYLMSLGETKFNFKQMRPLPTQTGFFNTKKGRYIYTKKGGWIDIAHFMFYAGKAYSYKVGGKSNPIGEAIQDGYQQEASDMFAAKHSAYSYEDLPSDRFGAEFAINFFNPKSDLTFGEQVANYLNNILEASDPHNAPNYDNIPLTDSEVAPKNTNNTTTPMYTKN